MKLSAFLLGFLVATPVQASITVVPATAAEMVDFLVSSDSTVKVVSGTPTLTGHQDCAGIFSAGRAAVPNGVLPGPDLNFPEEGIVISTGNPSALSFQTTDRKSHQFNTDGDADLDALLGVPTTTMDSCTLEFEFECTAEPCQISFEYIWGSEEYLEFVSSPFNDIFAWFLNDENIAVVPNTNTYVSVDTVNDQVNSAYFVDNDPSNPDYPFPNFEADGFTVPLTATGLASSTSVNSMKLVIADNSDAMFDSWALLKKKSFVGPRAAGAGGDPHFTRWGHEIRDTFHGECDLVVLQSKQFQDGTGLEIQIRTTIHEDLYSYIEAAALKIGQNALEIFNGSLRLDGMDFKDEDLPLTFGNEGKYEVDLESVEFFGNGTVKRRRYRLNLGSTSIEFKYYKNIMTFSIHGHEDFSDAVGILGSYPFGEMIGRDGSKISHFTEFAFEWQVGYDGQDSNIFSEDRSPQLPYELCRMPSSTFKTSRRRLRGNNSLVLEAQRACDHITGSNFDSCVDDVLATGDIELAKEW